MQYIDQINEAADFLRPSFSQPIDLAIILGSGLGPLADQIKAPKIIPTIHWFKAAAYYSMSYWIFNITIY